MVAASPAASRGRPITWWWERAPARSTIRRGSWESRSWTRPNSRPCWRSAEPRMQRGPDMRHAGTTTAELALPVPSLLALREALEADVGPDAAAHALRHAGHAAGDALYPMLNAGAEDAAGEPAQLPEAEFWRRVADLF